MADPASPAVPAKTLTTPAAPAAAAPGVMPASTAAVAAKQPGETAEDIVKVRALKPYLGAEDKRNLGMAGHADNEPYEVTRQRATELRTRGLAEYVDTADLDKEADAAVESAVTATRRKYEAKR